MGLGVVHALAHCRLEADAGAGRIGPGRACGRPRLGEAGARCGGRAVRARDGSRPRARDSDGAGLGTLRRLVARGLRLFG